MLSSGVDHIIDQVVYPKIYQDFKPEIDRVVCEYLGIDPEEWELKQKLKKELQAKQQQELEEQQQREAQQKLEQQQQQEAVAAAEQQSLGIYPNHFGICTTETCVNFQDHIKLLTDMK